jgi:hypothetical protein
VNQNGGKFKSNLDIQQGLATREFIQIKKFLRQNSSKITIY